MDNIERGITIVGGIANIAIAVNQKFGNKELAILLNLFDQKTSGGEEYVNSGKLVKKAMDHYSRIGETTTIDNIKTVYKDIDLTLLK